MTALTNRPPIVVTHMAGAAFAAQVRSHRVVVDQPLRSGGADTGPTPIELLGVSLGTCVALYVQQFCHARALPYEGLRIEVEPHSGSTPGRIERFVVRVILGSELPEHYVAMLERVAQSCPAHNTLTHGVDMAVLIEQAVAVV